VTPDARHPRLLAVDLGQSGSRIRTSDGVEFMEGPAFDQQAGLLVSIERTLTAAGSPQADVVILSLTGLRGEVPEPTAIGQGCGVITGAQTVGIADDGLAAHVGALHGADGVVLAVGSGVAVVARRGARACHRDGNGPVAGDDGSGFWIGREGLRAAVRASEDRGPSTRLVGDIERSHGALRGAIRSQSDGETMRWCITIARVVLEAAAHGDDVAMAIRAEAAARLAATAASAWRAVGQSDGPVRYSYTGGVMADAHLRVALHEHLLGLLPHAEFQPALGDNLDGALLIGRSLQQPVPPLLTWWNR